MYYLLKDGRVIDDRKQIVSIGTYTELDRPNASGEYLFTDDLAEELGQIEAKSENLLDLVREKDLLEIMQGKKSRKIEIDEDILEHMKFAIPTEAVALWKLSADGQTLTRHEVIEE